MKPALQPERETGMPEKIPANEALDGTTPINERVAHFREAIKQLEKEARSIDAFLRNPNVTDGPCMDKPIRDMDSRLNAIKQALQEISALKPSDVYEAQIDAILQRVLINMA